MTLRSERWIEVGRRIDGKPWAVRVVSHRGGLPGTRTVVLAGMLGDKPLGCRAVHELDRRLAQVGDLRGDVVLVPAANPPALEHATRENPDQRVLTRQFPGDGSGYLTDQLATALWNEVVEGADCVIDLHSGTPTMSLGYTYDYGDRALSASFGYLPVILGHTAPGQLGLLAAQKGIGFLLPEFGGGPLNDPLIGVEGCLNVLRHLGQLDGAPTGPATVPLVERKLLFRAATHGILEHSTLSAGDIGAVLAPGVLGRILDVATGETIEEFSSPVESVLLMTRTDPIMVRPGDFAYMTGPVATELAVGA
jgi:predicted deacylase